MPFMRQSNLGMKIRNWWRFFSKKWEVILREDGFFLLWMLIFSSSALSARFTTLEAASGTAELIGKIIKLPLHLLLGWAEIFLLVFLFSYLPRKLRRIVQWLFLIISGALFISDVFLLYSFGDVLDQAKIEIVMGTNPRTVLEFLQIYILNPTMAVALFIALAGIYLVYKFLRHRKIFLLSFLARHYQIIAFLSLFSVVFSLLMIGQLTAKEYLRSVREEMPMQIDPLRVEYYFDLPLNRLVMDTYEAYESIGNGEKINQAMADNRDTILANDSNIPYVIFILGESTDRNKMELYGYHLSTTPNLQQRLQQGNLFVFDDTLAPDTNTTGSMRKIFTFAEKDEEEPWYTKANLFDILHDAGYETFWLSNQSPVNINGNMDRIYSSHMDKADFTAIQGGGSGTVERHLDEELLPLLDNELAMDKAKKSFFVLHLYGAHGAYKLRYPESFAKFTAADETGGTEKQRQTKAEYDNAVLYDDWMVNEIIKRFEDKDAIIFFISDHGEEVYDGRDFAGHSTEAHGNRHMIEIPFLVWTSNSFASKRPEWVARIQQAEHQPYRTDWLIHGILDVIGIKTTSYDPTKSIWNADFQEHIRMWNGKPYVRQTPCQTP